MNTSGAHNAAAGPADRSNSFALSEANLRAIFKHAAVGIAAVDLEGHFLEVNSAFERLLGRSAAELRQMVFTDYTHPDDAGSDWEMFSELVRGEREQYELEKRILRKDGELVRGHLTVSLIRDEHGKPAYVIGMVVDRTQRARAEEELAEAKARYRSLVEQIPAVTYIWDFRSGLAQGTLPYVSPQIEGLVGYPPEAFMANPGLWWDLIHRDDWEAVMAETARSVEAGDRFECEYRMLARDGRTVWVRDDATVIMQEEGGKVLMHQGILMDITEGKAMEQELRDQWHQLTRTDAERRRLLSKLVAAEDEERQRIAANIHDDPVQKMTAVVVRLDMLAAAHPELLEDPMFPKLVHTVRASVESLRHLMFEVRPYTLDHDGLDAALQTMVQDEATADPTARYEVTWNVKASLAPDIGTVLYRIAKEAIVNARKHAGASLVSLSVTDEARGVCLRVRDDGSGFAAGVNEDSPPRHLGLTAMRERAEMAGGRFQVESEPGIGTSIEVWVPLTPVARAS